MNLLVILMQITGIGLILTAVDVFAVPWLRDALAPTAPTTAPDQEGHVVVCAHTPRTEALVEELDARGRAYVLVEPDEEQAMDLHEADYTVVHGDPESTDVLRAAQVGTARAVVADVADDTNASIVLSVRAVDPDVQVVTLVEDGDLAEYHSVAGADAVLSPRQLLGEQLAAELPTTVTTTATEGTTIGEEFDIVEFAVEAGSELAGAAVGEVSLQERFGVSVLGAWLNGDFQTPVDPATELDPGTRLLAAGDPDRLAELREATATRVRPLSPQQVIVAGYGDSGQAAHEVLAGTSSRLTVVDSEEADDVDVVGDARDPDVLADAGLPDASALLLMVGDDTAATLATLIARERNPDVRIVVRADEEDNIQKLYRAGADYVQSLATTSGRMLASTVFEDEDVLTYSEQISVVRLQAAGLAGTTVADAAIRSRTGCTVVAIVREDQTITDFDAEDFEFRADDDVIVAGADENTTAFEREFGG
jgi:Trk K+ transport system NAD-binding subunit